MSISDKFLGIFRVKDDDYDDDDDYYDDYEDEYEDIPKRKTSTRKKPKKKAVPDVDDDEDDYEDDDEQEDEPVVKKSTSRKRNTRSKVVHLDARSSGYAELCVIKPESVEDANEVSKTLLEGKAVILNLYGLDVSISQRIIDFSGGTCYAIDGNLKKVKDDIFVISPPSIDISGDIQELPNGDFDMSSITAKKIY